MTKAKSKPEPKTLVIKDYGSEKTLTITSHTLDKKREQDKVAKSPKTKNKSEMIETNVPGILGSQPTSTPQTVGSKTIHPGDINISCLQTPINIFKTLEYASNLFRERNLKYGNLDYSNHMIDVLNIGLEYIDLLIDIPSLIETENITNSVLNALICHDILEDCAITYNDLAKHIQYFAADIVYDVTNELGKNRKERSEKTYPKIKKNDYAIFVKCCDRLANVRFSKMEMEKNKSTMFTKYCMEYDEFKKELFNGKFIKLWIELDNAHK